MFHVRAEIVPCLRHIGFVEIDLVGGMFRFSMVFCSFSVGFLLSREKSSCLCKCRDKSLINPAVPPGLTLSRPLKRTLHAPSLRITDSQLRRPYSGNAPVLFALARPFTRGNFLPHSHHRRLSERRLIGGLLILLFGLMAKLLAPEGDKANTRFEKFFNPA